MYTAWRRRCDVHAARPVAVSFGIREQVERWTHRTTFVRGLRCIVAYRVGRILPRETVSVHGGGPSGVRRLWDRVSVGMIGVCGSSTTRVRAVGGESRWACAADGEARGACWAGRTWSGGHPGRPGCPGRAPRPATPRTILRRTDQLSSAHHAAENPRSQRGDIRGPALRWPMPERTCSSASPVSCSLSVNSTQQPTKGRGGATPNKYLCSPRLVELRRRTRLRDLAPRCHQLKGRVRR